MEDFSHNILRTKCVGTPGPGYPLLLSLGESLVVIVSYALTTEQPDPCGPEPYSPGKRPRTRTPLGKGPVAPRIPDPDPHTLSGPLSGVELTPRLGLVRNRPCHVPARRCGHARGAARLPLEDSPTYRIQCSRRKCALP